MVNVPVTVIIGIIGVILTAWFHRLHWVRSTREEIRVRETKEASELVQDIAGLFSKRIAAQRLLLENINSDDFNKYLNDYRDAVKIYMENYNEIRYRLTYFKSYSVVLDFEQELNDKIVLNSGQISLVIRRGKFLPEEKTKLSKELSVVSAEVYKFCARLSDDIAKEKVGRLRRISNWRDPNNEFVGNWALIKRLLNI